ncbi:helix-turn-helix transcriptional regulator [Loktanella sp. M215]|uniref:helix-turn-helix transcriptional regulator n=1 Tax=Loktanella sp. M215 TaxID=2675431 RepID=UPI001F28BDEB|nr:helix-turn-helix transcriptional regulator [Loktanella sp. M215]MCF7702226.1 LuxR family transcriptional regulator [Loktanella sp. M215]
MQIMTQGDTSLILDIYDTVLDTARWPQVLDRIAASLGARGCMIFELTPGTGSDRILTAPFISEKYDRTLVDDYLRTFSTIEIEDQDVFARFSATGDGIDVIGDHMLAADHATLAARPNARAMADYGIRYRAGALLSKDDPRRDRFSVQFSERHGPFTAEDAAKLQWILPHVAKACALARPVSQLAEMNSGLAEALDRFRIGVCLLRADGQIVMENAEFERQRTEAGVFRRLRDGRLEMCAAADRAWLADLMGSAHCHGRFGARPRKEALGSRSCRAGRLSVELAPITSADAFGERRLDGFALYSLDTGRPIDLDIGLVAQTLSFTASETALVGLLAEGLTNREIAQRRNRSVETVKTQVTSLLSKADCVNRTQFIRLVSNMGAKFLQ